MIRFYYWPVFHLLLVIICLAIYLASTRGLHLRRHPSAAISWIISFVLLPYIALPLYLVFGIRKINPHISTDKLLKFVTNSALPDTLSDKTKQLTAIMAMPEPSSYQQLEIHKNGTQALQVLQKMINEARKSIDICTFIIGHDSLGNQIIQSLKNRVRNGIQVRLLVDGFGAFLGSRHDLKDLASTGIQIAIFSPPFRSLFHRHANLRNHRKMVITDSKWLWCGGRNLAAKYFEGDPNYPGNLPWIDLSFDLRGSLAIQAQQLFEQDWNLTTQKKFKQYFTKNQKQPSSSNVAQLILSGPDRVDDTIYTILISGFFNAHNHILIVTPYFVPDQMLLMSLTLAARRGIKLDILIPNKTNHRLADIARNRALRELVSVGARIWVLPRMIHAKAIVIDDSFALAGTANLDERSLFLNYELMILFYGSTDVSRFAQWIKDHQYLATAYVARPIKFWQDILEGLLVWLAFQL